MGHDSAIQYFIYGTGAQLTQRKGVMPNALWYTDIYGLEVEKIIVMCFR